MTTVPIEGIMTFLNSMSLSTQNKRWLGEHLIEQAIKEESMTNNAPSRKRVVRMRRQSVNTPTDAELEARFSGKEMPPMPEDPDWSQVINANKGKIIKPIEKWL